MKQQFKIRASQAGKIMNVKGLGKTGEDYVKMWEKSQFFNREIEIKSKYLDKGNICEDEAIEILEPYFGTHKKNEKHFEDDFFTGTPDVITSDSIIDVKNSWDWSTFPLFDKEIPNVDYYYQLQIYMHLTNLKKAFLVYVLNDTPQHLIEREAFLYCRNLGLDEVETDVYEQFEKKMTYSDIEIKDRVKMFEISYNEVVIDKIKDRVLMCRELLK